MTLVSSSWPDHSPPVAMIQPPQEVYLYNLRLATGPGKQDWEQQFPARAVCLLWYRSPQ